MDRGLAASRGVRVGIVKRLEPDSLAYQAMNIVASVLLLVNTLYYGAYPSSFVNAVWTVIAVAAIASVVRRKAEPT